MGINVSALTAVAYAGIGTAVGALIQSIGGHRESSAHAATMVMSANTDFASTVAGENARLTGETHTLRKALVKMTDAMDVVLDAMDAMLRCSVEDCPAKNRDAIALARKAIAVAREANALGKTVL